MQKLLGNSFLGKFHVSYIQERFQNYFRNNFRLQCSKSLFRPFWHGKQRGNKRCFLNGVFQSGVFRGWLGTPKCLETLVFPSIFCPCERVCLCCRSRWGIWKTPFRKHRLEPLVRVFQTCLSWSAFRVSQRYRTRCHPGPSPMPQECPKISPKKRAWYQPRRHVCIVKFLLRTGDSQTVICKPCSENSWTKGWTWGVLSRSARNSLKSPFSNHH